MKNIGIKILSLALIVVMALGCTVPSGAKKECKSYEMGQVIEFGSYPQTRVTDETTIQVLDAIEADSHAYEGYYEAVLGSDYGDRDFKENKNMMSYKDVEYNGEKYRGVLIKSYRPSDATCVSDEKNSYQDDHGYTRSNKYYWFKYEPLKWRIFDTEKGLAICEKVIDAQPFNSTYMYSVGGYQNFGTTVSYSNDFCGSQLCSWLNGHFLNTAFTAEEQEKIPGTTVDTRFEDGNSGLNRGATITKKVVLLTYNQALGRTEERDYGTVSYTKEIFDFPNDDFTDYAESQGGKFVAGWWLATPETRETLLVKNVFPGSYEDVDFSGISSQEAYSASNGVRPVISFGKADAFADDKDNTEIKNNKDNKDSADGSVNFMIAIIIAGAAVSIMAVVVVTAVIIIKKKKAEK